jgi:hypothetical protein
VKTTENECVDCGFPCLGNVCPHRNVTRFYCDRCGEETTLYHYDGEELCIECIKEDLGVVEGSDI